MSHTVKSFVYGLRFRKDGHPFDGAIRYVGKAFDPVRRMRRHTNPRDQHGKIGRSIMKHGAACFSMEILEEVRAADRADADRLAGIAEARWIVHLETATGPHGLNLTLGGDGVRLTGEALEQQRERSRHNLREVLSRPEVREKLRRQQIERFRDPKYLAAHRSRVKNRKKAPGYQERHRAAMDKLFASPAHMAKISDHMRSLWKDPAFRAAAAERTADMNRDPNLRKKRSATLKRHFEDPQRRKEKADTSKRLHRDPEFARRYREGLAKKHADPEFVAAKAALSKDRQINGNLGLLCKLGIALRWEARHRTAGKLDAANLQLCKLTMLVDELDRRFPETSARSLESARTLIAARGASSPPKTNLEAA